TAPVGALWASHTDLGGYIIEEASSRSLRVYTTVHPLADLLADLDSNTATLSGLWARYIDGPTPSAAAFGTDQSGNGRNLTVSGTAVTDSDDPVASSGPDPITADGAVTIPVTVAGA